MHFSVEIDFEGGSLALYRATVSSVDSELSFAQSLFLRAVYIAISGCFTREYPVSTRMGSVGGDMLTAVQRKLYDPALIRAGYIQYS